MSDDFMKFKQIEHIYNGSFIISAGIHGMYFWKWEVSFGCFFINCCLIYSLDRRQRYTMQNIIENTNI